MKKLPLFLLVLLPIAAVTPNGASAPAADEWPVFRGPNHDGKSPDQGLLKAWPEGGPPRLWTAPGIGQGFSSVSVSGGRIYITGDVGDQLMLTAFDLAGKKVWQVPVGPTGKLNRPGSRATPTIDGGQLYLLSGQGEMGCYDAKTGRRLWARETREYGGRPGNWGYAESVLILDRLAIFKPGGQNCIVAVDKTSGRDVWRSSGFSAGPEYSSCLPFTFGGKQLIATGTKAGLVCVNAADGRFLWKNDFSANNTANCPTPAFSDGYMVWANGYGKGGIGVKLQPDGSAQEVWRSSEFVCHHGGYVIEGGYVYGNHSAGWTCLDLKTGAKKWFERAVGKGSLCWADGMLYLFSETSGQAALATCSPQGLEIKGRVKVDGTGPSWAHPVVIGGRLYLRYDTTLYCFDVRKK